MRRDKLAGLLIGLLGSAAMVASACDGGGGGGAGGAGATASTGTSQISGLPCDVAEVVQSQCASCHGNPPTSSAPQSLLSVADWRAPSKADPSMSNGEASVLRMQLASAPMPPGGLSDAASVAIIADWVNAGMPEGECDTNVEDPLLNAAPICTSMDLWPAGQDEAPGKEREEMTPGMPCLDCHSNPAKYGFDETGPDFSLAGTVYPTGHEPDLCAGLDGTTLADVIVRIEDANGKTWDLRPNQAGNFFIEEQPVAMPYSAKVLNQHGERVMNLKPDNGDCNLCHTQNGSTGPNPMGPLAPGRIVPPAPPRP